MNYSVDWDGPGESDRDTFICADCGREVLAAVPGAIYEHPDSLCMNCQFIRNNPSLSEWTKALLRGSDK